MVVGKQRSEQGAGSGRASDGIQKVVPVLGQVLVLLESQGHVHNGRELEHHCKEQPKAQSHSIVDLGSILLERLRQSVECRVALVHGVAVVLDAEGGQSAKIQSSEGSDETDFTASVEVDDDVLHQLVIFLLLALSEATAAAGLDSHVSILKLAGCCFKLNLLLFQALARGFVVRPDLFCYLELVFQLRWLVESTEIRGVSHALYTKI